ncbi:MAG: tetratricopeptide repeat protein [Magnetococcales bacterium]|nr:tetratricopeptide repeat protein [Magnetococcales bacterium]
MIRLADLEDLRGDPQKSYRHIEQAVKIIETELGNVHPILLPHLLRLTDLLLRRGSQNEARSLLARAESIVTERFGNRGPLFALLSARKASLPEGAAGDEGSDARNEAILRDLKARIHAQLPGSPARAMALRRLGDHYRRQGNWGRAISLYHRSLELLMASDGPYHAARVSLLRDLALLEQGLGEEARAIDHLQWAIALTESEYGTESPELMPLLTALGHSQRVMGQPSQGRLGLARALEISLRVRGKEHPGTAIATTELGEAFLLEKEYVPAKLMFVRAVEILRAQPSGSLSPELARALIGLASVQDRQESFSEAIRNQREALIILVKRLGAEHPQSVDARNTYLSFVEAANRRALGDPGRPRERFQDRIRDLQDRLAAIGLDPGPVNGRIGVRTKSALISFEKQLGLSLSADIDEESLARILLYLPVVNSRGGPDEAS